MAKKISARDFEYRQMLSIFESIDEPIYVSDPESYEVLFANSILQKTFGNVIGQKCYKAFQGRNSPCPFCTNKYIFGKKPGKTYIWIFKNRRNKRYYKCIDKAILWPTGKMVRCEIAIDITEQKKAEELYRDLVERAGIAILIDDEEGRIKYGNRRFAEIFGYSQDEIKKLSIRSVVHPDDLKKVMKYHSGRIKGKKVPSRYEFKGIRKDGTITILKLVPFL